MSTDGYYKIDYPILGESLCCGEYPNGFKAYVIQKNGFSKTFASIGTHYGSINSSFLTKFDEKPVVVPDGIAHFLEHKLFEQADGNVLQKYAVLGASPNAYTTFAKTAYLFSCTDNFGSCLDLLLDFVRKPYFTDENVEKEKGIIEQEIDMYEDNAEFKGYFNFLKSMYKVNPVRLEIAGTKESIANITKELLLQCHATFYHPSNMIMVVVGNVDPDEVFSKIAATIGAEDTNPIEIKRITGEEPKALNSAYFEYWMEISTPRFFAGFKDFPKAFSGNEAAIRQIGMSVLLELIMGKSSPLYENLYSLGLINNTFSTEYNIEENYAYSCFGGESKDPDAAKRIIIDEIKRIKKDGFDQEALSRILKSFKGKSIRSLDSIERIASDFLTLNFKGCILFDYFGLYDKITVDYLKELVDEHFDEEFFCLTKILPK